MVCAAAALLWCGCDLGLKNEAPQPTQAPIQAPIPQPVVPVQPVAAPPPPATPLIPIAENTSSSVGGKRTGKDDVDKPIPGKETSGEEHVGMYSCNLSTGLPINPPGIGCRIFKANDGSIKIGSSSSGMTSINGTISKSTALGFFFTGSYKFPGNEVNIATRMVRKANATEYGGSGRGRLNNSKTNLIKYKLTMVKK
jgi:hypothetical protein